MKEQEAFEAAMYANYTKGASGGRFQGRNTRDLDKRLIRSVVTARNEDLINLRFAGRYPKMLTSTPSTRSKKQNQPILLN